MKNEQRSKPRETWSLEKIEEFRAWHEQKLNDLYPGCADVQAELRRTTGKFLLSLTPR
jgi:hypothetical protein